MAANAQDGMTNEERAKKSRAVAAIRALAACVNQGAIHSLIEEPMTGVYAAGVPYNAQTRTVTFVVNADAYDLGFNPQGVERPRATGPRGSRSERG